MKKQGYTTFYTILATLEVGQKHRSGKKKKKKEKKACDNNGPQSPADERAQLPRPTTSPPVYHVNNLSWE